MASLRSFRSRSFASHSLITLARLTELSLAGAVTAQPVIVDGDASIIVAAVGAVNSASVVVDGDVLVTVAVAGVAASQSGAVDGDLSVYVAVDGDAQAQAAVGDGAASSSVALDGDVQAQLGTTGGVLAVSSSEEFLHPVSDLLNDGWTGQDGGTIDLWHYIDEGSVPNNLDYVRSPLVPAGQSFRITLTNPIETVVAYEPVIVEYSYGKSAGGGTVNMAFSLWEGSTLIAEWQHNNVAQGFVIASQQLTGEQLAMISSFADLEVEVAAESI